MQTKNFKFPDTNSFDYVMAEFNRKGVTIHNIAQIAYDLQHGYPDAAHLTIHDFEESVLDIMHKREFLNSAMTGLSLDNAAEHNQLPEPFNSIVRADAGVFGVDEALATTVAQLYGQIGVTNYGYVDKTKPGIIGELDRDKTHINTFIDDLVGAVVAATAGKIAHENA